MKKKTNWVEREINHGGSEDDDPCPNRCREWTQGTAAQGGDTSGGG